MLQTPKKSLKMYEECISSVVEVLREGRTGGARDFFFTSDLKCRTGSDVHR